MKITHSALQPTAQRISNILVARIKESIVTLRTEYNQEKLGELGDSLEDQGQLQTIVVQQDENDPDYYELVIGSRRLRAARLKGKSLIAAYVIERRDPAELLLIALAENLHRDDLNPFEEARAFLRLTKEYSLSPREIAERVNKPLSFVTGRLQLLTMPDEIVRMIADRQLPINSLRSLIRLPNGNDQVRHARLMIQHHLSQSELTTQIQEELKQPPRPDHQHYEFTPTKLVARLLQFKKFVEKVPRRLRAEQLNSAEKERIKDVIEKLEMNLKALKGQLEITSNIMVSRSLLPDVDPKSVMNNGQEWTVADIQRINASNRPSDEVLSIELGRTIASIRSMRTKASKQ